MSAKPSEKVAVGATIDPDAYGTGAENTDWLSMVDFQQALFIVLAGIIAASGVLDFKIQEAKTSTGGSGQDLATGTLSITQLTTANNDSQVLVNIETEDLSEDFAYVRGVMTFGTAGGDAAVIGLGLRPRYAPASDDDLASVAEITG